VPKKWFSVSLISVCCLAAAETSFVTQGALRELLLASPLEITRARDNAHVTLKFNADGTVYLRTTRPSGQVVTSTGNWNLNDKGLKFCMEFADSATTGGCFGLMQEGKRLSVYTGRKRAPVLYGSAGD
jgi:hypothetical protein